MKALRIETISISVAELEILLLRAVLRWHEGLQRLYSTEELLGYLGLSRSTWRRLCAEDPALQQHLVYQRKRGVKVVRRWLAPAVELHLRQSHGWQPRRGQ